MGPHGFLYAHEKDYATLQRAYHARGFSGECHDASILRRGQALRLIDGAEPTYSHINFSDSPNAGLRYAPYKPCSSGALC